MFFYVYLQPGVLDEVRDEGDDAILSFISILGGFLQNCFIAIYEDGHWTDEVKDALKKWPETMLRSRVKRLLANFKKRKRFQYAVRPDYLGDKDDIKCVFEQYLEIPLDMIVLVDAQKVPEEFPIATHSTRKTYLTSIFEERRAELISSGSTCHPGQLTQVDFLNIHFDRALKHATEIQFIDRICGINFADNYKFTTNMLLKWLANILIDPSRCTIIFHFGLPARNRSAYILQEIESFRTSHLSNTTIRVIFYEDQNGKPGLPHQRFLLTDQIALNIDRGLDFLDRSTNKCRDVYVSYVNPDEVRNLLSKYSINALEPHRLQ